MKTKLLLVIFCIFVRLAVDGQITKGINLLKQELEKSKPDTNRVLILDYISFNYLSVTPDSAKYYSEEALALAEKLNYLRGQSRIYNTRGKLERNLGNLPKALYSVYKGMQIAEENNYLLEKAFCMSSLGEIYGDLNDYQKAKYFFYSVEKLLDSKQINDDELRFNLYLNKSWVYRRSNLMDTVFINLKKAEAMLPKITLPGDSNYYYVEYGNAQFRIGNHELGIESMHKSIDISEKNNLPRRSSWSYCSLADFFKRLNQPDSAIFYAKKAIAVAQTIDYKTGILRAANILANVYDSIDPIKAIVYFKLAKEVNDAIYGNEKFLELQKAISAEQDRQRKLEADKIAYQNKIKLYSLLLGILILILIGFLLYRNNLQKHKANILLHEQKMEIQNTLTQLKSTQSQLIQSEKMASLGELTAGIAHEIQNPLNFVNNFSEVSKEMLEELKAERLKPSTERNEQTQDEIINDLIANEEKINHHGKRADSIVKGMLQHSQASTGKKEPANINALCDEYLRLAYHGLRAKNKDFNADLKTDFDGTIGNINIIPQDIGRVLLNLYNNAFYAASLPSPEKIGIDAGGFKDPDYVHKPAVWVSTKNLGAQVEIKVRDNGPGIPQKILDKIFQPFFTTKPTGQGTGLGLSLSYDIIKAHSGELKVETKEDEGSTFIIQIPIIND